MRFPKVSIIIVNYNGIDDTLECLNSLKSLSYPNCEVIVIDNASRNASSALNRIYNDFPNVKIISLGQNLGFAGGNNVGIDYALKQQKAEYVLLLNNDTVVAPDFLKKMVEADESDKDIGIVGAKIYYHSDPTRIWYNGGYLNWTDGGKHKEYNQIDANPNDAKIKPTNFVTGCALLIKTETILKIGLMDESFFMYYEDIDWSLRAKEAGYKTVIATGAHIWHKVSRSAIKMGEPKRHYYHIRNAMLLAKKHASPLTFKMLILWSRYYYLKQIIKSVLLPSKKEISQMIMLGIKDFNRKRFGEFKNNL